MKAFFKKLQRRLLHILIPKLGLLYFYCAGNTSKVITVGAEELAQLRKQHPRVILVGWHEQSLFFAWLTRNQGITVLVSQSRDGEYIANVLHALGFHTTRGSSSRGGSQALRQLVTVLKKRGDVGIIVDGPRGPALECKPGAVMLAQLSGVPIIPVAVASTRCKRVNSWDQTCIPLPFSTMRIHFGQPIVFARSDNPEELADMQQQVNQALNTLTNIAQTALIHSHHDKKLYPPRENS